MQSEVRTVVIFRNVITDGMPGNITLEVSKALMDFKIGQWIYNVFDRTVEGVMVYGSH